ncbi:AT-hook motif nuclear-localized protein 14 isoform X1 [Malania oleifera]|uniref:AT-hook motif nuclear-localized protein 14 isoform X1 n=1 Tax=Malania oleifera TaxID=397392 RepID=UPI0025AE77CA|nr:AT-hook motif nuclear-localized protein 14 isoform X1 [Malania oleifera]
MEKNIPSLIDPFLCNLMEPNGSSLSSYYQQPPQQQAPPPPPPQHQSPTAAPVQPPRPPPPNGIQPNAAAYPHSAPAASEPGKRKRGRPRKYGTSEQGGTKAASSPPPSSAVHLSSFSPTRRDQSFGAAAGGSVSSSSGSSKKSQLPALGNAGQGFTPHIINVSAGEDVAQKIMFFMQQSKRELCILSASGSISNASLRQPAMSGGNVTIEGRFEILSLSGSYVRTELGGRTGGLSVCLSTTDGQVLGGGVGGPLKAAGPVQVIVGTFLIDAKTDVSAGVKGDASLSKLPSQFGGVSVSSADFQPVVEHTGRNPIRGNDDDQSIGGSHFMVEPHGMQMSHSHPTSWTGGIDGRSSAPYEFTGRTAHGSQESPENGDYERLPD